MVYSSSSRTLRSPDMNLHDRTHSFLDSIFETEAERGTESDYGILDRLLSFSNFMSCVQQPITLCVSGSFPDTCDCDLDRGFNCDPACYSTCAETAKRSRKGRRRRSIGTESDNDDCSSICQGPSDSSLIIFAEHSQPGHPHRIVTRKTSERITQGLNSQPQTYSPTIRKQKPGVNDVVCGRGGNSVSHPGTERFRELCQANRLTYSGLTKKQKIIMSRQIVSMIHSAVPEGHFVVRDSTLGHWVDIGLHRSLDKVARALRERSVSTYPDENVYTVDSIRNHSRSPALVTATEPQCSSLRTRVSKSSGKQSYTLPVPVVPFHLQSVFQLPPPPPPPLKPQPSTCDSQINPSLSDHSESLQEITPLSPLYRPLSRFSQPVAVSLSCQSIILDSALHDQPPILSLLEPTLDEDSPSTRLLSSTNGLALTSQSALLPPLPPFHDVDGVNEDVSDSSMDGGTALATTAFLKLDEMSC